MTSRTILVDLRAAQFNGDRGIPAYVQSLTIELVRGRPEHRWLLWHDPRRPLPSRAAELTAYATWCTSDELQGVPRIDVLVTGCFFLPDHRHAADSLLPEWLKAQRPRRLGIVYDLVPLLFPDRYLDRERARRQYHDCLGVLRQSDHLFAISQATRRDVIRHAAVDPARVHCIYGDIDHAKRALMARSVASTADVPTQYGLTGPYCVCIGGDDWRKNLDGAVRGFAIFHRDHPEHQLAIVCSLSAARITSIHHLADSLGLPEGTIRCTGYVPDEALVPLVQHAALLVYPSRYEGLGLPVLEAHGCGTPVVGSNVSSVAELVIPELACDPENPAAIAEAMIRAVRSPELQGASRLFGKRLLAQEMGWDKAAGAVMASIAEPARTWALSTPARPRLAVIAALPPARTGTAHLALAHLQSDQWETTFYDANPGPTLTTQDKLLPLSRVLPAEVFPAASIRDHHDAAIFVLGNSSHHAGVLEAMMRSRGCAMRRLAYLHECGLESLFRSWLGDTARSQRLPSPPPAQGGIPDWISRALAAKPTLSHWLGFLAERAELDGVIVNSAACRDLIQATLGSLADRWTIDVAFNPVVDPAITLSGVKGKDEILRVGSFGLAGDMKRLDLVSDAVTILRRHRPVQLVIAGWEARRYCRRAGIAGKASVEVIESPGDERLREAMRGTDVAVQLRSPTFGESSGVVNQVLALGRPLVVTDAGSFAELPESLATHVSPDCSAAALAEAIERRVSKPIDPSCLTDFIAARSPAAFTARITAILTGVSIDESDRSSTKTAQPRTR